MRHVRAQKRIINRVNDQLSYDAVRPGKPWLLNRTASKAYQTDLAKPVLRIASRTDKEVEITMSAVIPVAKMEESIHYEHELIYKHPSAHRYSMTYHGFWEVDLFPCLKAVPTVQKCLQSLPVCRRRTRDGRYDGEPCGRTNE